MSRPVERRWPLAPFFEVTGWTMADIREVAPCGGDEWKRRHTEGVTERIADRIATAAGHHPWTIWPDMDQAAAETVSVVCQGCYVAFVPEHPLRTYCTPECRQRARWRRRAATVRARDPERERARKRRWAQESGDYLARYKARWVDANRDHVNAYHREYQRAARQKTRDTGPATTSPPGAHDPAMTTTGAP